MAVTDGLELPIGLTEKQFLQQLARVEAKAIKSAERAENAFRKANGLIANSTRTMTQSVSNGYAGISRNATIAAASALALAASLKKFTDVSDSYKKVESQLRSVGEYSDQAAERLAAAALRSRSSVEDMATSVARIQKASGAGYDETIRRVETLNKLLAVGGSTAGEVSSVVTQLSQALSSGALQGDELKSLREAAPIEVLDAIAKAAGGTRAELKDLGAEGKLTSQVVLQALDELAVGADQRFAATALTVGQALTNIGSGLTVFVGRLDEGLGGTDRLATGLNDLATWLVDNASAAEAFGLSVVAALQTADYYVQETKKFFDDLAASIHEKLIGASDALGISFLDASGDAGGAVEAIIGAVSTLNGVLNGAAEAATEAFLMIPDAVTSGLQAAINAIIGAVETMVNTVLDGVRSVASGVDALTAAIAAIPGASSVATNLAGGVGNVNFGRVENLATNNSTRGISEAYSAGKAEGERQVEGAVEAVKGFVAGVEERFTKNREALERDNNAADTKPVVTIPPAAPSAIPASSGTGGGKGRGGGGGGSKSKDPLGELQAETQALLDQAKAFEQLRGTGENWGQSIAIIEQSQKLLNEAQRAGIAITPEYKARVDAAVAAYAEAKDRMEEVRDATKRGQDAMGDLFGSMLEGADSAKQALGNLLKEIAKIQFNKAVMGLLGLGGGGLLGGLGSLLSPNANGGVYSGAGISAYSGKVVSRPTVFPFAKGAGLMGEAGPEAIMPLTRINGKLGVRTEGGAASPKIVINNNAPGVEVSTESVTRDEVRLMISKGIAGNARAGQDQQYLRGGQR